MGGRNPLHTTVGGAPGVYTGWCHISSTPACETLTQQKYPSSRSNCRLKRHTGNGQHNAKTRDADTASAQQHMLCSTVEGRPRTRLLQLLLLQLLTVSCTHQSIALHTHLCGMQRTRSAEPSTGQVERHPSPPRQPANTATPYQPDGAPTTPETPPQIQAGQTQSNTV